MPFTLVLCHVIGQSRDFRLNVCFCLPIFLGVVSSSYEVLWLKEVAYSFKKLTHQLCTAVFQYVGGYFVWYDLMVVENRRNVRGICFWGWHSLCELGISISCDCRELVAFVVFGNGPRIRGNDLYWVAGKQEFSNFTFASYCLGFGCIHSNLSRLCINCWSCEVNIPRVKWFRIFCVLQGVRPVAGSDTRVENTPVVILERHSALLQW